MKIDVTAEDIQNGKREVCCFCPIALAIKRAFNVTHGVSVGGADVIIDEGDKIGAFDLPQSAVNFIEAFDSCNPVEPFSFEIEGL